MGNQRLIRDAKMLSLTGRACHTNKEGSSVVLFEQHIRAITNCMNQRLSHACGLCAWLAFQAHFLAKL